MPVTRWTPTTFRNAGFGRRYGWIDLVNSDYHDGLGGKTDYLDDDAWLALFLSAWGLATSRHASMPKAAFRALRGQLHEAVRQVTQRGAISSGMLRSLNLTLANEVARAIETRGDRYALVIRPISADWTWAQSQIVASFGVFLEADQLHRLKVCANAACQWVFYDETKGNTRRWCNDRRCGNRDKVRRHRAKRMP